LLYYNIINQVELTTMSMGHEKKSPVIHEHLKRKTASCIALLPVLDMSVMAISRYLTVFEKNKPKGVDPRI
jgi:hypothetical protein